MECIVVECPGQDCLWLARNLGLVLVKRELRRARDAAMYRRWVNSEFVGFPGGVWLPKRSEREFWTEEEATSTPTCRVRLVAEDVRWQAEPDLTRSYRLTFASGTQVLDEIKGVYYRVNARGLPILENSIIDARANLSSQAALAPSLWISLPMILGGLGMVLVAWLVWHRVIYS